MCALDSPWEIPEEFLASEAAKALANEGLRVAVEFKLDRAGDHPKGPESDLTPERLRRAYAHLDLAILKRKDDPWALKLDGIVEFKKHSSLANDAGLINFMITKKHATYGVLALLVVGSSKSDVVRKTQQLIAPLTGDGTWRRLPDDPPPEQYPPLQNTDVGDRWWNVYCLVTP